MFNVKNSKQSEERLHFYTNFWTFFLSICLFFKTNMFFFLKSIVYLSILLSWLFVNFFICLSFFNCYFPFSYSNVYLLILVLQSLQFALSFWILFYSLFFFVSLFNCLFVYSSDLRGVGIYTLKTKSCEVYYSTVHSIAISQAVYTQCL